jgi:DNA-binding transcriptional LysR family regulator
MLEIEWGTTLFDRAHDGMRLTEAGVVVVERTRRALRELEAARAQLASAQSRPAIVVSVGLPESMAGALAEPLVAVIGKRYAQVRLQVRVDDSEQLRRRLMAGELDLSLLYQPVDMGPLEWTPLVTESLWVVAPARVDFRAQSPIFLRDIAHEPLVTPALGDPVRDLLGCTATCDGLTLTVGTQTNSLVLLKNLVQNGYGLGAIPGIACAAEIVGGLLSGAPLITPARLVTVLARVRGRVLSEFAAAVADELTEQVRIAVADLRWSTVELC